MHCLPGPWCDSNIIIILYRGRGSKRSVERSKRRRNDGNSRHSEMAKCNYLIMTNSQVTTMYLCRGFVGTHTRTNIFCII